MFKISYTIEESIEIKASIDKVWENISSFKNMTKWSPWLVMDKKSKLDYSINDTEIGSKFSWDSNILWSWEETIKEITTKKEIKLDLNFLKPFKGNSKVKITLEQNSSIVKVVWTMDSTIPLFVFFLKKMISSMISRDFKRWLNMLKTLCETGNLETESMLDWISNYDSFYRIWIKKSAYKRDIHEELSGVFWKLHSVIAEKNINILWVVNFSTENTCVEKDFFEFIVWFKVSEIDYNSFEQYNDFIKWFEKWTKAIKVTHKWSYEFLSNSWTLAMSQPRQLKVKVDKYKYPFEEYVNNPHEVEEKDLITYIYVPVK